MQFFRDIWRTIFGKKTEDNKFKKGGVIINSDEDFFTSEQTIEKEIKTDAKFIEPAELGKVKRKKSVVGKEKLLLIKDYLVTNGSIDVITCEQIFKVKSLRNFIWELRKDGFVIETKKITLHNEIGKKIIVTNYRLIHKEQNGTN